MFRKVVIACALLLAVCGSNFVAVHSVQAQNLTPEERTTLQAQYDELQKEIAVQQQIIKDTQAKKNTLQGDVTLLNAQIKAAQAQINAKNITIKQLSAQIAKKIRLSGNSRTASKEGRSRSRPCCVRLRCWTIFRSSASHSVRRAFPVFLAIWTPSPPSKPTFKLFCRYSRRKGADRK